MSEAGNPGPEGATGRSLEAKKSDVAGGKRSEDALRVSEAMFAGIVSIAADAIVSIDEDQRIILFNRGAEEMFGYRAEEVMGKPLGILLPEAVRSVHPQHVREFAASAKRARRIGERGGVSGRRKDGQIFPVEASISKIDVAGKRIYTAVLRDISASVRAEEALQRANETLQAIVQASPLAIVAVDLDTNVEIWNAAAERIFGWTEEEVIGAAYPAVPPDRKEEFAEKMEAARRGEALVGVEAERIRKDGKRITVSLSTAPLPGRQGEVRGVMALIEDVTERKRAREAQERLRRQTEEIQRFLAESGRVLAATLEYESTLQNLTELVVPRLADVCLVDLVEGDEVHRVAAKHKEPSRAERLMRRPSSYASDEGSVGPKQVIRTGEPDLVRRVTDAWLRAAMDDGGEYQVMRELAPRSAMVVPLVAHRRIIGSVLLATTEGARSYGPADLALAEGLAANAALAIDNARLYRQSRKAVRTRDEVLRVVAHDLRDPLGTIGLTAGLLLERAGGERPRDRARERDQLAIIRRTVDRANRLIDDLLDVAKMEAGQLPLRCAAVAPLPLVHETMELHVRLAQEKEHRLESDLPDQLPLVRADRDRVLQVFGNLIGNAIKFTPAGGRVCLSAEQQGGEVVFSVSDSGPGIAEEQLGRLFEPFWQAAVSKKEGAGLGLAICRGIVEAHGGRIWVESRPHHGTTFRFTLPVAAAATRPDRAAAD